MSCGQNKRSNKSKEDNSRQCDVERVWVINIRAHYMQNKLVVNTAPFLLLDVLIILDGLREPCALCRFKNYVTDLSLCGTHCGCPLSFCCVHSQLCEDESPQGLHGTPLCLACMLYVYAMQRGGGDSSYPCSLTYGCQRALQ